ncbi:MAG: amidohydrolase [Cyclobacteriaceae bacterium]
MTIFDKICAFQPIRQAVLLLISSFILSCSPEVETKYILIHGGTILTVDEAFSEVEAMVVEEQKIIATGDFDELNQKFGQQSELFNLEGKTMLPGFIDPHAHVVSFAPIVYLTEDIGLVNFETTDEVLDHLKGLVSEREPGEWIMASNWDPAVQDGVPALTVKELDDVSTEHPIFVLNTSGHLAYVNSKAFEVAGITNNIENPPGAEYVRDADGNLNGVIKNNVAFLPIWKSNPKVDKVDLAESITFLLGAFNKYGITTTSEFSLGASTQSTTEFDILIESSKREDFTGRVMAYPFYTLNDQWTKAGVKMYDGNDLAMLTGFKLIADGSNQGFTGLQRECYYNERAFGPKMECNHGVAYMTVEEMTAISEQRIAEGWQLALHGNGDGAIDNILETMQILTDKGYDIKKHRPRIEHCSILHDDQIKKMKALGISASFLIGHVHYWGTFMRDSVFGSDKVQLLDRCASVEKEGISYTLQSDFSVTQPDMLKMVEIAVVRNTFKEPDYILAPQERISVESAIRAITSEAAWQLMIEDKVGTLEAGKYADLVILEKDPRRVEPSEISEIKVVETWLNGKQVYAAD